MEYFGNFDFDIEFVTLQAEIIATKKSPSLINNRLKKKIAVRTMVL